MTLLTEAEAKEKWCPLARDMMSHGGNRTAYGAGDGCSPEETEDADSFKQCGAEMADLHPCIGSACMAWRWEKTPQPKMQRWGVILDGKPEEIWYWNPTNSNTYGDRVAVREIPEGEIILRGWCGAFGRPE